MEIYKIKKPSNWKKLKMHEKIRYYGTQLTKEFSPYVDKLEARLIVKDICGDTIKFTNIRKYMSGFNDLLLEDIKEPCIIKTSHSSGWNIFIEDPTKEDINIIKKKLESFNKPYSYTVEKQYNYIKPRYFIEDFLDDKYYGKNGHALDYMIRCIHGTPVSISVQSKLLKKQNTYNLDWKPFTPIKLPNIEKPKHFEKLINLAKLLSKIFEFVRMDFFIDKNDDIYFGEFTFTPAGGDKVFPDTLERSLGRLWI